MTEFTSAEIAVSLSITPSANFFSARSYASVAQPGRPVTASQSPTTKPLAPECRLSTRSLTISRSFLNWVVRTVFAASHFTMALGARSFSSALTAVCASSKAALASAPALARICSSVPTMPSWRAPVRLTVPWRDAVERLERLHLEARHVGVGLAERVLLLGEDFGRVLLGRPVELALRRARLGDRAALHELRGRLVHAGGFSLLARRRHILVERHAPSGTGSGTAAFALIEAVAVAAGWGGIGAPCCAGAGAGLVAMAP